jgi:hypothetical protein
LKREEVATSVNLSSQFYETVSLILYLQYVILYQIAVTVTHLDFGMIRCDTIPSKAKWHRKFLVHVHYRIFTLTQQSVGCVEPCWARAHDSNTDWSAGLRNIAVETPRENEP